MFTQVTFSDVEVHILSNPFVQVNSSGGWVTGVLRNELLSNPALNSLTTAETWSN